MKKFLMKHASVFAALALVVSTIGANRLCAYHYGQPVAPASLKKLRKF